MSKNSLSTKTILGGLYSAANLVTSVVAPWPPVPVPDVCRNVTSQEVIPCPSNGNTPVGAIVFAVLGATALVALGIYAYYKHKNRPVAHALALGDDLEPGIHPSPRHYAAG